MWIGYRNISELKTDCLATYYDGFIDNSSIGLLGEPAWSELLMIKLQWLQVVESNYQRLHLNNLYILPVYFADAKNRSLVLASSNECFDS